MAVKVLFLDYDGVIVDSMGPKAEAIADAFAPYSDDRAAIADGFHRHAGSGREAQFDRIYKDLTGETLDAPARARIVAAFLARVDAINDAVGLFPGVHDFVVAQAAKRLVAVVTGVPQDEASRQLARFGLSPFIASVHGATRETPKHVHMKRVLEARGLAHGRRPLCRRFADRHAAGGAGRHPLRRHRHAGFLCRRRAAGGGPQPARPRGPARRVRPGSPSVPPTFPSGTRRD